MSEHYTDEEYKSGVSAVWKATIILGILTIVEVAVALILGPHIPKLLLNSFFIIASVAKAFFIIGEFMHLKYEKRAFILSLGLPLVFLVWLIIAFLLDGHSWFIANHPY